MPKTFFEAPRFTGVLKYEITGKETVLWLRGQDNKKYRVEFDVSAVGAVVDALQAHVSSRRGVALLTLTPMKIDPIATPDRKGLRIQTKEAGTIALDLSDETFSQLRKSLGDLVSLTAPSRTQ